MSTDLRETLPPGVRSAVDEYIDERLACKLDGAVRSALAEAKATRLCIIASKGTLDMAYPPFILASTGAALGLECAIFFTFYGLELLKKDLRLQVDSIGNPAMPGHSPNLVAVLPGMRNLSTWLMRTMFEKRGVASLGELRQTCLDSGVRLMACEMTMDVMGYRQEEFVGGVELAGAAAFLQEATRPGATALFI